MTEMVYGSLPVRAGEPILPRWWSTIDRWSLSCVLMLFGIGLLLGLASSPPLAARNGFEAFHYVQRQAIFGSAALVALVLTTMMSPVVVRRLAVLGFLCAFAALAALPFAGTDFGKGAVRWYSLGFASIQPSEFLKPGFVVVTAWMIAASQELGGPPGKRLSLTMTIVIVGFLAMQPDFGQACLVLFAWGVIYFVAGAPITLLLILAGVVVFVGTMAYANSEHFARRIDGFLSPDVDPTTQLGYATNAIREGGFFGVGVGEGEVKWSLARCAYGFHHRRGGGRVWPADGAVRDRALCHHRRAVADAADARARSVHPSGGHRVGLCLWRAGDDQYGRGRAAVARQGHDAAVCQLWRVVPDCGRDCRGDAAGLHTGASAGRDRGYPDPARTVSAPLAIIAAGGSGGHMFPAQSLAETLLARGWHVRLSTDDRGARYAGGFPDAVEISRVASATFARGRDIRQGRGAGSGFQRCAGSVAADAGRAACDCGGLWRLSVDPGNGGGDFAEDPPVDP